MYLKNYEMGAILLAGGTFMATTVNHLIKQLQDPMKEMSLVRHGINTEVIELFLDQQDLSIKDVLKSLDISSSTYFSKKKTHKNLDAYTTEKFFRLISVITLATDILGDAESKNWLNRKIPSLGNEIPLNLLDTEAGHRLVIQTLLQIKYGIYS